MLRTFSGIAAIALVIFCASSEVSGQTIAAESFDVPPNPDQTMSNIDGLAGATSFGFDGGFTGVSSALLVSSIAGNIVPPGSPITNVGGFLGIADGTGPGSGDRFARALNTSDFANLGFLDADGNISGADGTSLYLGFVYQSLDANNANSALEFNLDGVDNQFSFGNDGGDLGVGGDNAFGFDVNAASPDFGTTAGDAIAAGPGVTSTASNTFVIRIDYDATGDIATLFANPTDTIEANQTPVGATTTLGVSLAFDEIGYLNFSNSLGALIDEIRIGTTFGDALVTNQAVFLEGNVDGDTDIDLDDFNLLRSNYFNTGDPGSVIGEAVGAIDGVVDINDFLAFRNAFEAAGGNASLLSLSSAGVVPEPSSFLLLGMSLAGSLGIRRRR